MFLLLCYGPVARRLILALYELGLLNGEYVPITIEVLPTACIERDGLDELACKAFEGVIDVSQYVPESQAYKDFETGVYNRMPEMGFNMSAPNEVSVSIL